MKRFNNRSIKKSKTFHILFIFVLALSIGFAAYAATLKIRGTFGVLPTNVSVVWSDVNVSEGSVSGTPEIDNETSTEVSVTATLNKPGDFHEFTVVATNDGDIDAMVSSVNSKLYLVSGEDEEEVTLPSYLSYSFTYSDDKKIVKNHLLAENESETYKVRIEVRKDITASDLPTSDYQYRFEFSVDYSYADDDAVEVLHPVSFATDSWATIAQNAREGSVSKYNVGDTREISLNDGNSTTHTLRIANNTTPNVCNGSNYSQTACGLVVEFTDIISTYQMNENSDNDGGWEDSVMRTYVNNTIYDYLPSDLRKEIVDTKVVSGHGNCNSTNFTTTDKMYLLSPKELGVVLDYDMSKDSTRVLDYYNLSTSSVLKSYSGSYTGWWLRSAVGENCDEYYYVIDYFDSDKIYSNSASSDFGVSPAFRLG